MNTACLRWVSPEANPETRIRSKLLIKENLVKERQTEKEKKTSKGVSSDNTLQKPLQLILQGKSGM